MLIHQQYALITGASSGIGSATALAFADRGIHLALVGRDRDRLEAVADASRAKGVKAETHRLDLAHLAQVKDQISAIVTALPRLDFVINCAGMGHTGNLLETSLADWQQVIDLNLTSVFQCIQGVLPTLRAQRCGTIINIASVAAHQTFPGWGPYCVSKFGLLALSKTLAAEERSHGIRVVTVSPGSVNTPLWDTDSVQADFDRSAMLTPDVVAQSIVYTAMLPTSAVVEELVLMPNAGTF